MPVPLFWTQAGYGLKPPPQLSPDRTHEQNLDIMRRYFQRSAVRYGSHASFIPSLSPVPYFIALTPA